MRCPTASRGALVNKLRMALDVGIRARRWPDKIQNVTNEPVILLKTKDTDFGTRQVNENKLLIYDNPSCY
jgi:hypothetical protein